MIHSIILSMVLSIVGGQTNIPYRNTVTTPQQTEIFEKSILIPNHFQMNQSFSLSTSMGGNINQTSAIFSNFASYKLSERINLNMDLHLIQNQNNISYTTKPKMGIGYKLGMEYKLSQNSLISLQVINFNNSPVLYQNFSPFNVP